jgi:hypothetical protein
MANSRIKGVIRRIRRGKATILLAEGGTVKCPAGNFKIGDKVVLGYDFTTNKLRNVWPEGYFNNVRLAESAKVDGEDDDERVAIITER